MLNIKYISKNTSRHIHSVNYNNCFREQLEHEIIPASRLASQCIHCKDMTIFQTYVRKWAVQKKTDTTMCLYILPGVVAEGPFYHSVNSDCRYYAG